jgi:hypothetical protein
LEGKYLSNEDYSTQLEQNQKKEQQARQEASDLDWHS